jgi:polyphenol oxidase
MIRWSPPGPYEVVFATREGGVSAGPYASLNLGRMTGDDVDRIDENRRILCAEIGAEPEKLALNRQIHSSTVRRAEAGSRGRPADGLWTDEPGLPILAMAADCLPIALVRAGGEEPAVAVLHAGWRGILGGIIGEGVRALGGTVHAAIGPGIGPCCYEVGEEVLVRFATLGAGVARGRMLDLAEVARRQLRDAGVENVTSAGICTSCEPELFFSHRRDGGRSGRQAGLVWSEG